MKWTKIRESVLKRDHYKCRKCGTSGNLVVHHKDGSGGTEKPNNDLDNLLTLCGHCHAKLEAIIWNNITKKKMGIDKLPKSHYLTGEASPLYKQIRLDPIVAKMFNIQQ